VKVHKIQKCMSIISTFEWNCIMYLWKRCSLTLSIICILRYFLNTKIKVYLLCKLLIVHRLSHLGWSLAFSRLHYFIKYITTTQVLNYKKFKFTSKDYKCIYTLMYNKLNILFCFICLSIPIFCAIHTNTIIYFKLCLFNIV